VFEASSFTLPFPLLSRRPGRSWLGVLFRNPCFLFKGPLFVDTTSFDQFGCSYLFPFLPPLLLRSLPPTPPDRPGRHRRACPSKSLYLQSPDIVRFFFYIRGRCAFFPPRTFFAFFRSARRFFCLLGRIAFFLTSECLQRMRFFPFPCAPPLSTPIVPPCPPVLGLLPWPSFAPFSLQSDTRVLWFLLSFFLPEPRARFSSRYTLSLVD